MITSYLSSVIKRIKSEKYFQWLLVGAIMLFAAYLRLYKISDYMTFLGDEGRDALVVYNILHGRLTLLGPTSSVGGFFLGPIYYYFMAPFLWLFKYNPVGPAIMVALFGIATVWLVYRVGAEFFNRKTGIIAATLYSISPLVIAYSRSSWNPNLMPFFSLVTLYVLYKALERNDAKLFLLSGLLYGITMQLHYAGLFIASIIIAFLFLSELFLYKTFWFTSIVKTIKRGVLLLSGFIIGLSPFFMFEIRHGFPNIRSITNFILRSGETGRNEQFLSTITNVFFRLFGRLITKFPPPEQVSLQANLNIAIWYYATLLLGIFSVGLFLFYFYQTFKKNRKEASKLLLLLLWFFIGIFIFGFYKKPIYDYYFGFMFPLPFLLVGNLFSSLYDSLLGKVGKFIAIGVFAYLFLINISGVPFRFPPNKQKDQVEKIAKFVLSKADEKPFNFALLTLGNSDHGYRYFFEIRKRTPVAIENTQKDPGRKTVTDQLLIVCEDPNCKPLGSPLWEVAGFGRAEIVGEWDVSVVKVYKLIHYRGG